MARVNIWIDGSGHKDGRGGWGVAVETLDGWEDHCGGEFDTTNNRMELTAAIHALQLFPPKSKLCLISDSQYVLNGITDHIEGWVKRRWRTSQNEPVKNQDLWERLLELSSKHDIIWRWVKGHSGVEGNERADELAAKGTPKETSTARRVRRTR